MGNNQFLDPLDAQKIREFLVSDGLHDVRNINVFSSITSTNDYLLDSSYANEEISVCLSEQQTKGRGRYGHQWVSPHAANLYLSISWPFQDWIEEYETLSLWLLVAMAELLEKYGCNHIQLKWPNDLCFDNKKLAGVLIERKVGPTKNSLIIGLGLNVAMSRYNDVNIDTPWVDLLTIQSDWNLSRNKLAADAVTSFYQTLIGLGKSKLGSINSKWRSYDMLVNKKIQFLNKGKTDSGWVKGIDEVGNIVLDLDGNITHMHSSRISEIKITGKV